MSDYRQSPCQYSVYKGKTGKAGALQFDLLPFDPSKTEHTNDRKEIEKLKKGVVFVTAGKAVGPDDYDWDNKVVLAMSATDLGQFLAGTAGGGEEGTELVNIYHQHDSSSKKLIVKQGRLDRNNKPTFMVTMMKDKYAVTVPLSLSEMYIIRGLFTAAMPRILGW